MHPDVDIQLEAGAAFARVTFQSPAGREAFMVADDLELLVAGVPIEIGPHVREAAAASPGVTVFVVDLQTLDVV